MSLNVLSSPLTSGFRCAIFKLLENIPPRQNTKQSRACAGGGAVWCFAVKYYKKDAIL